MSFKDLLNEAMGQDFLPTNPTEYKLLTLTKPEDVIEHGLGTKWDTSTGKRMKPNRHRYEEAIRIASLYLRAGPMYIVLKNGKPFVQMAAGHELIVNADDDPNFKIDDSLRRFLQRAVDNGQITDNMLVNTIESRVEAPGLPDFGDED